MTTREGGEIAIGNTDSRMRFRFHGCDGEPDYLATVLAQGTAESPAISGWFTFRASLLEMREDGMLSDTRDHGYALGA